MAKFYGQIGFATTKEVKPGIYKEVIEEKSYYGNLTKSSRSLYSSEYANDDINISNTISVVADPYSLQHIFNMRYVIFQGAKWKIKNVEVKERRIDLTVGGLWNET